MLHKIHELAGKCPVCGKEINFFTPAAISPQPNMKPLPHITFPDGNPAGYHIVHYFMKHSFFYDPTWDIDKFVENNQIQIEASRQEIGFVSSDPDFIPKKLYLLVRFADRKNKLIDA